MASSKWKERQGGAGISIAPKGMPPIALLPSTSPHLLTGCERSEKCDRYIIDGPLLQIPVQEEVSSFSSSGVGVLYARALGPPVKWTWLSFLTGRWARTLSVAWGYWSWLLWQDNCTLKTCNETQWMPAVQTPGLPVGGLARSPTNTLRCFSFSPSSYSPPSHPHSSSLMKTYPVIWWDLIADR